MSTQATPPARTAEGATSARLPAWPFVALFGPFLLWWVLGISDSIWIPAGAVMAYYLISRRAFLVPRGFGIWLLLLVWITVSTVRVSSGGDLIGGVYRLLLYYSLTVLFLYVYNARASLTVRVVTGVFTLWLVTLTIGGYLGVLFPAVEFSTPMAKIIPSGLQTNPMIAEMVHKGLSEFDTGYFQLEPRPKVPFLYTNNWGNVYSLLLPVVAVHLLMNTGRRRFWFVAALFPLSAIPAMLTLNRGMFIGIALTLLYVAVRLAMQRRFAAILGVAVTGALAFTLFNLLPVSERIDNRLPEGGNSNTTRMSLYEQALAMVPGSPVFGYGAPQPPKNAFEAPVGTQGFVWMLLVSFGPMAVALFVAFFVVAIGRIIRRNDLFGIAMSAVLITGLVEHLYYGLLPNGLAVMLPIAALAFREGRGSPAPPRQTVVHPKERPSASSSSALNGA